MNETYCNELLAEIAYPIRAANMIESQILNSAIMVDLLTQDFDRNTRLPLLANAVYRSSVVGNFQDKFLLRDILRPVLQLAVKSMSALNSIACLNLFYLLPEAVDNFSTQVPEFLEGFDTTQWAWIWCNRDAFPFAEKYLRVVLQRNAEKSFSAERDKILMCYIQACYVNFEGQFLAARLREFEIGRQPQGDRNDIVHELMASRAERESEIKGTVVRSRITDEGGGFRKPRIAVCVTGQLRGFIQASTTWTEIFQKDAEYKFFVSTWGTNGRRGFSWAHLNRLFDKAASAELLKFRDRVGVERATDILQQFFAELPDEIISEKAVANVLSRYGSSVVSILDERDPRYACMPNPEKMYFHNINAFKILEPELEEFDLVVKMRPDILLGYRRFPNFWQRLLLRLDGRDEILAETGYRYEEWGFGVGDQFAVGNKKMMRNYMSVHERGEMHGRIMNEIYRNKAQRFKGHVSLAYDLWKKGTEVDIAPVEVKGLANIEKLGLAALQSVISFNG